MSSDPKEVRVLRRKAEKLLSEAPERLALMSGSDLQLLVHELSVHQIELEMQNEELRVSRQQLEQSRSEYADLYDFAPVGYLTFDNAGLITRANLTAAGLLGIERSLLVKKPLALFIHPESQDTFYFHQRKVLATGTAQTCQLVLKRKDGTFFDAQLESVAVQVDGQPAINAVLIDITQRKRTEDALRRQAALLDLSPDAIMIRDMDGTITLWSHGAVLLYGWTKDEALGRTSWSLLKTRFPEPLEKINRQVRLTGQWSGELVHATRDGREVVVQSRWLAQRKTDGSIAEILESNVDITEQKHIEGQLRRAQKMEALGTVTGGIAHDFNNILAAMIGFTELVAGHVPASDRDRHYLDRVLQAGLRGRELIRQMLTFSSKTEQEKKPLRLGSIVKESVRLLRASIPTTISIRVDVEGESGLILADPVQMQQVLMNLCTNATHAMREKGGTLDIAVSDYLASSPERSDGMRPGPYVRLVVRDTGTGIAPEIRERIFDPFFSTKEVGESSGLGLSVVHGIVRQSDGYITVESEPESGTAFTIYLPAVAEETAREPATDSELFTGSERILFVDDEESLVEMGEEILTEIGYTVVSRMDSREALLLVKEDPSRFDLVITDQTMPGLTGIELSRQILALRPDMPIILCTGFSHIVDEASARTAGIKALVTKPLTKSEIARTIRKVLDG